MSDFKQLKQMLKAQEKQRKAETKVIKSLEKRGKEIRKELAKKNGEV